MSTLTNKLLQYAQNNLNTLIIGALGIGKTTITKMIADSLGYKFKYYSTPTLDPWADLVGIPVPNNDIKSIEFYRPKDLEDAEFVFFDELNRAHPRTLNAVLEIIQFKSINGKKLPNLKMVWAAINPPGGQYQVEDLDPVLVDRFHVYVEMKSVIDMDYMKTVLQPKTAEALSTWWHTDCDEKQREFLSPRRIEYIGRVIDAGLPWKDSLPPVHTFPVQDLSKRLESLVSGNYSELKVSKEDILANLNKYIEKLDKDPSFVLKIKNYFIKFKAQDFFESRDLLEKFPSDILAEISRKKFLPMRKQLKNIFETKKIDITKYPKISNSFFGEKKKV